MRPFFIHPETRFFPFERRFGAMMSRVETFASSLPRVAAFGLLVVLLAWESVAPFFAFYRQRMAERVRHDAVNFVMGGLNAIFNATVATALWLLVSDWAAGEGFGLLHWLAWPAGLELVVAVLCLDLWMYVWHRLCHVLPLLWRFHRVHHSDRRMDVSTAYRFHFGEMVASALARLPVIALLGLTLGQLLAFEALMFSVVQVQHANVAVPASLDRCLRWFFVTPFMHKVHHSDRQPETDSNYCSLFSWWDRVFGTYRERADPSAIRFGLPEVPIGESQALRSLLLNPFQAAESNKEVASGGKTVEAGGSTTQANHLK
jgi:sterol desaturase/sphingolipid hydroxylase (fatty acid hydroxylase superfamily)